MERPDADEVLEQFDKAKGAPSQQNDQHVGFLHRLRETQGRQCP